MSAELPRIVAVVGPTGTGKTDLGAALCRLFGGEIVSTDSMQIYRGMDIGTAKEKGLDVPQHLIDICDPGERMTAGRFQGLAYQAIDGLLARGRLPVLVGVSMLYAEAVLNGYVFSDTGKSDLQEPKYRSLKIGVSMEREELKRRIARRTAIWAESGLVEEIRRLISEGVDAGWLMSCGQEYRYFTEHVLGRIGLDEAIVKTNISINQYTKRTNTWWRRHDDVHWVANEREARRLVEGFLSS